MARMVAIIVAIIMAIIMAIINRTIFYSMSLLGDFLQQSADPSCAVLYAALRAAPGIG